MKSRSTHFAVAGVLAVVSAGWWASTALAEAGSTKASTALRPAGKGEPVAAQPAGAKTTDAARADLVRRGNYIVSTSGCDDCHTPFKLGPNGPEPDFSRRLSGHPAAVKMTPPPKLEMPWGWAGAATNTAFAGPWGISYTANLTPDKKTGLGAWTPQNFVDTIRTGRHLGRGRQILPPMPYPVYRNMTDEDLEAVFAFLQSLPPIENRVPEPTPPSAN